jgi:hypothetical protein
MAGQSFSAMKSIEDQFRNNSGRLLKAIQTIIPDCLGIHWTHLDNDRLGVDCLLELAGAGVLKIDFKFRRYQAIEEWIILESFSDKERKKLGWAVDNRKKNDFFVFVRFHNNGAITEIMAVRRKAINELLLTRYDECSTVGKVRNANSYQNGNNWTGEFIAFTPQNLASLLEPTDYKYSAIAWGDL